MTPSDRRYTKTHEWVAMADGVAVIGISDHAQEQLGDITFIELPEVGASFEAGEECLVVESVKAASDVYAPVTGTVIEVNTQLATRPELVNEDAYGVGWMMKMTDVDPDSVAALMDAAAYEALVSDLED